MACACSRTPEPPAGAAAHGGSAHLPADTAEACLARADEAYERREYDRARVDFERARALFEESQGFEGYVRARNGLGASSQRQGDHTTALEHLNAALAMAQAKLGPRHPLLARTYLELGAVHATRGQPKDALELFGKALELERASRSGSPLLAGRILRRMADAYSSLGDDERAIVLLDEAAALQRQDPPELAETYVTKGNALWGQGRYDQSIEVFEQAIAILEGQKDVRVRSLAGAYLNLGNCYWSKGDTEEARAYYEKALPLLKAALGESHPEVGAAEFNLAVVHQLRLDHDAAIAAAERALRIYVPALGERHMDVVQTYTVLASALVGKGEADRALAVAEKALRLQLSLAGGERSSAVVYSTLGGAYEAKGDLARAERYHRQALEVDQSIYGRRHPDVAEDFVLLGDLHLKRGDESLALRAYGQAIAANDPQEAGAEPDLHPPFDTVFSEELLLKALKGAARARAQRGAKQKRPRDVEEAALVYGHASALIDRLRAGYRGEGSKLKLAASAGETYDEAIRCELDLLRRTGEERHLEAAYRYAEKSKAGILRDALNESEARAFAGIPRALLDQERRLRADLAATERRLLEGQLDGDKADEELRPLRDKQFAESREYGALQARFEKDYPEYYDLKYRFETAPAKEVRERALDEGTVLVEYFLGRDRIFIFTLTRQDLAVTSVVRDASFEPELLALRQAIAERDLDGYARSAHRLYRQLLAPVEERLEGRDLVIVPDGPLSTVPFEALLKREVSPLPGGAHDLPYVLRDHAVSYAYSATVLLQGLRRQEEPTPDELVAFAPAFAEGTPRLRDAPLPLPGSRQEVADVRGLFAKRQGLFGGWLSSRSRVYIGPEATERRLKSSGLERYRYVHLATHGIVDEEHPGLSRLLLMPEAGSGEDGVLHLGEIYDLHLNADLVVLSACDTGRGRIARGEGLIGFTRGFLYAGAKSLLVSLWPVSDAAASGLVVDFYAELLGGRPKARALREAKLRTIARNPEYAKPYYWAPLVLVGRWR